jgi:glycosyltransferase involved in cell wall biosynthesis
MNMHATLVMRVKNEAATIGNSIRTACARQTAEDTLPISSVTIYDTGSTDETVAEATRAAAEVGAKIEIVHGTFVDYGTSRNAALDADARLDPTPRWQIMLSGGETVTAPASREIMARAFVDGVAYVRFSLGGANHVSLRWTRAVGGRVSARYVGKTHEVITPPHDAVLDSGLTLVHTRTVHDVERDVARWKRDVQLLEPDAWTDPRAMYYLAQSYHCLHDYDRSREWYTRRWEWAAGFAEERYVSVLRLFDLPWSPDTNLVSLGWKAIAMAPQRGEVPAKLAALFAADHRWSELFALSSFVTLHEGGHSQPGLLENRPCSWWRIAELTARGAYYVGLRARARELFEKAKAWAPPDEELIVRNAHHYGVV